MVTVWGFPFSFLFSLYSLPIISFSYLKKNRLIVTICKMSINKISAQFKNRKLTVASSTVLLGTLQHFPVSVSQLCPQPFETFKTDKLRCKVHSKKHSDEGSDKKIKQKACFQLFLASVEGQILVSTIKDRGAAINSSTAAMKSPVMPL